MATSLATFQYKRGPNYLLLKDDIGRPKPSVRKLPNQSFTFGKPEIRDSENAGVITTSWKLHNRSKVPETDKDFKRLNMVSVNQKATTAHVSSIPSHSGSI